MVKGSSDTPKKDSKKEPGLKIDDRVSKAEAKEMGLLPNKGIYLSLEKANRLFRSCDQIQRELATGIIMTLPEKLKKDIENPEGFLEESDEDPVSDDCISRALRQEADCALELITFIRRVHETARECSDDRDVESTFQKSRWPC